MKKAYESPKAEKMNFDYSETVVASAAKCRNETHYTDGNDQGAYCTITVTYHAVGDTMPTT